MISADRHGWWFTLMVVGAGLLVAIGRVADAGAQTQAEVGANAIVLGGNITVEAENALEFGDVLPGGPHDIDITSSQSGRWRVTGTPGAEVRLEFLLPSLLVFGSNSMPITFGADQAGYFIFNVPGFATLFNPQDGTSALLRSFFGGMLYVWLGGTILPAASQPPGLYEGSATLVTTYTGN